jgi:hypothetical protein
MKWGAEMLPQKPVPISRYRKRRRAPFTELASFLCALIIWAGLVLFTALLTSDIWVLVMAGTGVGMGGAIAIYVRNRRFL